MDEPLGQSSSDGGRAHVHASWASVAPRWAASADEGDRRLRPVTDRLLACTQPEPGSHVLELACGPGGTGLAAAELVGPGGVVVLSDVVPAMCAIASERARRRGARVRTTVIDLDGLDEPEAAYDVVLCREGLMFSFDPAAALARVQRCLRPGGRVGISTWGPRERNPWLGLVFDAVTAVTGRVVPPPGIPGPFALGDAARLRGLLAGAGFADVAVEEVPVPLHAPTLEAWWQRTVDLAGPLATVLAALPPAAGAAIRAHAQAAAQASVGAAGVDLPGVVLVGCGVRP